VVTRRFVQKEQLLRNVFDQYEQPENRLTHALATVLYQERRLIRPFLRWLGIREIPKARKLMVAEQQVPGALQDINEEINESGLPDISIYDDVGFAVLVESKVQACINLKQLEKHRKTAKRRGYKLPWLVLVSVEKPSCKLRDRTIAVAWQDLYAWFNKQDRKLHWPIQLVSYMQVFERKMLSNDYQIKGTITVFDGLRFDDANPYTYREGKRQLRLLADILQKRRDLEKAIGIDPTGERRPAITGKGGNAVWDFIPLKKARNMPFTSYPHLTISIHRKQVLAAVTVPNGIKGGFRQKLRTEGPDGFLEVIHDLERRLRPVVRRSKGAKPMIYASQRHFRTQKSAAVVDAHLEADLRTAFTTKVTGVRHQPQWIDAIYEVLVNKRSNIQLGVEVLFRYTCPRVRSLEIVELFADTWKALAPLIKFVTE
jgi:hypothetical protein